MVSGYDSSCSPINLLKYIADKNIEIESELKISANEINKNSPC